MTVPVQTPYQKTIGNGVTTVFPYSFKVLESTDLKVLVGGTVVTPASITGLGNEIGGTVTLTTAPGAGVEVFTYSDTLIRRQVDYQTNGDFREAVVDADLDRIWLAIRDVNGRASRAIRAPTGETINELPAAATRANGFLGFDADGQPTMLAAADLGATPVSGYMTTLLDDATSHEARATLGASTQPCVTMIRSADSSNDTLTSASWKVYKPDGSRLDTTGTTTEGLQEAINYAAQFGYDLFVYGGGIKPQVFGVPYGGALGTNPFTTTNGSNIVTVTHTAHGLTTGAKVTFDGLSAALNGIPEAQIENVEKTITVTGVNSYTFTTSSNATSSGAAGGSSVRFQHSGQDVSIISCTTGIVVPPLQLVRWDIHATINFGGSATTPAIKFNSILNSHIAIIGQVVASATYESCVAFVPDAELPQDGLAGPVVGVNYICLFSTVHVGGGICVDIDARNGTIAHNTFDIFEPNGGAIGVRVQAGLNTAVFDNRFRVMDCHAQSASCINEGFSSTHAANIFGNMWEATCSGDAGCVGVEMWGRQNSWKLSITNLEGTPTNGVTLNTTAQKNTITFLRNDATTKVNDAATEKSNALHFPKSFLRAHKNGTAQTGVVTSTWTDVTFGTEVLDTLSEFSSATFTASQPGVYLACASVAFDSVNTAVIVQAAIAKNGTRIAAGRNGNELGSAATVSANVTTLVEMAAGDTLKVQGWHDHGSNRDISGDVTLTRLSITRLQGS